MAAEHRRKIGDAQRFRTTPATKRCPRCGETKPAGSFGLRRRSADDNVLNAYCAACKKDKSKEFERRRKPRPKVARRPRATEAQRFMAMVAKAPDGCWTWTGGIKENGYGNFKTARRRTITAHKWSYLHFVGPIPEGLQLDHTCHTADESCNAGNACRHRRCVNPAHLEPVTLQVNRLRGRRWPKSAKSKGAA